MEENEEGGEGNRRRVESIYLQTWPVLLVCNLSERDESCATRVDAELDASPALLAASASAPTHTSRQHIDDPIGLQFSMERLLVHNFGCDIEIAYWPGSVSNMLLCCYSLCLTELTHGNYCGTGRRRESWQTLSRSWHHSQSHWSCIAVCCSS